MGFRIKLKPSTGTNKKPQDFSVCDIEAYKWTEFRVIGWYNGTDYIAYKSMYEFIEAMWEESEKIIYAHFGGIYDFMFIIKGILENTDYKIKNMIPRGSGLLCFDMVRVDKNGEEEKITFMDSSAMFPFGLSNLTKSFKVKHTKQEFDFETWDGVLTEELLGYLKDDCRGLYECIDAYRNWDLIKKAGPAHTMASQAIKVLRLFLKEDIDSLGDRADTFVRRGYFGGRTEIFRPEYKGKKKLYCYDVNSLYPYVMRNNEFPNKCKGFTYTYDPKAMGFFEAEVEVPKDMYLPPLPYVHKMERSEKLIFPTGRFKGVWSTIEIEYARSLGVKILSTGRGITFKNGGYIFKSFIDTLYKMRKMAQKVGDGVGDVLTKLLMNSCYGRFGLNKNRENLVFDDFSEGQKPHSEFIIKRPVYAMGGGGKVREKEYTVRLMLEKTVLEKTHTHVGIAAWVTALSRIHMHKTMWPCKGELYYTDSIVADRYVLIKNKSRVEVVQIEELYNNLSIEETTGEKSAKDGEGIETFSWNSSLQEPEWKKIRRVIRHKNNKKIYRVRDNKGSSVTTEDHSFIDKHNNKISPNDLATTFSCKDLSSLNNESTTMIDLYDELPKVVEGKNTVYDLCYDSKFCWYERRITYKRLKPLNRVEKIQRYYEGEDLENLLKILGYYITEGSVSDHNTSSRFNSAISSDKIDLHEELLIHLRKFFPLSSFNHIKSSKKDNTFKIINGGLLSCVVFKSLGGQKSAGKKIPDFIFTLPLEMKKIFLDWLILGDGSKVFGKNYSKEYKAKNFRYDTTSKKLLNQLCVLISFMGYCYSVCYRAEKKIWTISTSKKNMDKKPTISEVQYAGYVYDLEVEDNNNFFDCEGLIGLHNTDSLFTTKKTKTGEELGELKEEYSCTKAVFLLPKTYVVEDGRDFRKLAMKGFDKRKIKHFKYEDFFTALEGDLRHMKITHDAKFAKFKTAAKKGDLTTLLPPQDRQIRSLYDKRIVSRRGNKFNSHPIHL